MTRSPKPRPEPLTAAPAAAVAPPPVEPLAAPAAAAPEAAKAAPAAGAPRPTLALRRVLEVMEQRLAGTRAERLLEQGRVHLDALPRRLEAEVDALLDRVGLVRKSRTATATTTEAAPKAA